ncbi:E3 ubiquitin-protein ligase RZFP34 [Beta vulgaris subsp. vulgaris]|uniref:E3 ubiquitin-protein ligase RZFP34 n=1 Tax=Beta vulgaris subsp. vulgaris TaxID=3555 RepID=UPI002036EAB8|nr:E3 ubiquitin-protein ligase RZFP34 [Beta vulgaris subsp. vulgaris]
MSCGCQTQLPINSPEIHFEVSSFSSVDLMELASGIHGCRHYRRRCKIRAPCCNEIFDCRHCHNEEKNSLEIDPLDRHDIPRHEIGKVICSLCGVEQDVQQNCVNCGIVMGKYFCSKCNFFDDDVSKKQYHCDECGICRTGGEENFFHCLSCGCCYPKIMKDTHRCLEKAMHQNCPVCCEYLFDTTKDVSVLACGHAMHFECAKQMEQHYRYACPICLKSMCDMSKVWKKLDEEVASTPLPEECQRMVQILCNDCEATSEVQYHVLAHKCLNCSSYNTKLIR